jgi:hypothetical protein
MACIRIDNGNPDYMGSGTMHAAADLLPIPGPLALQRRK